MFGTLSWSDLLQPAIRLAERDEPYDARITPAQQRDLAATLRLIASGGRDGFYRGATARLIAEEMERGGGLITQEDLARYEAKTRTPVVGLYRGHRVVSMPPPSSGGAILIQLLNMIEFFAPAELGHNTTEYINLICELEKRAFADRAKWLGDSDFFDVPRDTLTSKTYARRRVEGVTPERRSFPSQIREGPAREKEETTHFSVVDKWGNAVANTYTLNDSYGSGIVVTGAGFLLNNEMDDFAVKPGVPNLYGVTGGEANSIAPDKRMLSSMSPTFVYKPDGSLWLVLGTPGGPTIITSVFQVILNRLEHRMTLADAVAAPRFHHQWPPASAARDVVRCEETIETGGLKALGYAIEQRRIGDVHAIEIDRATRSARGASDPRGRGAVAIE